jgi:hypothetical protein
MDDASEAPTDPGSSTEHPLGITSERRAAPRFQVALSAEERGPGMQLFWTTTDLSTSGLSMRDSFSRKPGTRLQLELHLGDGRRPLSVQAEVVGPFDAQGGVRVRFLTLTPAEAVRIEQALRIHGVG